MQLIPYVFLEILTYILGGYWYLLCEMLSVCANVLAEDFHQVKSHIECKKLDRTSIMLRWSSLCLIKIRDV